MATNEERRWVSLEPRGRVGRRTVERTGLGQWGTVRSQTLEVLSMGKGSLIFNLTHPRKVAVGGSHL